MMSAPPAAAAARLAKRGLFSMGPAALEPAIVMKSLHERGEIQYTKGPRNARLWEVVG